jgi:hypothetical protein
MKNYFKYLISFALAALLGTTVFIGCAVDNSDPGNAPQQSIVTQEELAPAIDVQERHMKELMAIDGVNGTGVGVDDAGTPIIYVFTLREGVAGIPASVEGIDTRTEFIGEVKALAGGGNNKGFKGTYRSPMWSGVSVGNANECAAGTIGCVVKKNVEGTDHFFLLSNNHVFARENAASLNEIIGQPGRYDNNCAVAGAVANLSQFIPIVFSGSNTCDAAIAEIANGITYTSRMANNSYMPSATTQNAAVNMTVKKTGRTTGLTTGRVGAVNVSVNVGYDGGVANFIGQVYVKTAGFCAAGDSGSLIVESATNRPVSLLYAGSQSGATFGNPINAVLNAFGVTISAN